MLSNTQKEKLKACWGEQAEAMECLAEVRVYDPLSPWECYIIALDPSDDDEMFCIINGMFVEACSWTLQELEALYNSDGDHVRIDTEYKPRQAKEIYKTLTRMNHDT